MIPAEGNFRDQIEVGSGNCHRGATARGAGGRTDGRHRRRRGGRVGELVRGGRCRSAARRRHSDVDRGSGFGRRSRRDSRVRNDRERNGQGSAVAPVNPLPVTVTTVPPAVLPLFGLTPVTLGAEAAV